MRDEDLRVAHHGDGEEEEEHERHGQRPQGVPRQLLRLQPASHARVW